MKSILATIAALLLLFGCSETEVAEDAGTPEQAAVSASTYDLAGTWVMDADFTEEDKVKLGEFMTDEQINKMIDEIKSMRLVINADGTYKMPIPQMKNMMKDTWKIEGDTLILASSGMIFSSQEELDASYDLPEEEIVPNKIPMSLNIEADGTELVMAETSGEMTSRLAFKRQ